MPLADEDIEKIPEQLKLLDLEQISEPDEIIDFSIDSSSKR